MSLWYTVPIEKIIEHCRHTTHALKLPEQELTFIMSSGDRGVSVDVGIAPGLHEVFDLDRGHPDELQHVHW